MSDTGSQEPVQVPDSFDVFFRDEYSTVAALLYTICGSRWAAEDLAQEAFLRAHRDWGRVGAMAYPGRWVRRVGINLAMSRFRTRAAEARALVRLGRPPTSIAAPLESEFEAFWAEVRRLPRRQREVIALRYVEDLTVDQIAEVLGIAAGTVRASLHRGRAALEQTLRNAGWWLT